MTGPYRFTTNSQKLGSDSEIEWGGDTGWDSQINQQEGITIETGSIIPAVVPEIPTDGLVARWEFNEEEGSTVTDRVGSREGTLHGVRWVDAPARGSRVLQFDGNGDYASIDGWSGITGTQSRTWAVWFKSQDTESTHRFLSYGDWSDGNKYEMRTDTSNGNSLRVENEDGQKYGSTSVVDGDWHLLTVVYPENGTHVQDHNLYVDAQLETDTGGTDQALNTASSTDVWFGKSHWHEGDTAAHIAAVYAYNRALSQTEIQTIYDNTR